MLKSGRDDVSLCTKTCRMPFKRTLLPIDVEAA
uniref:Uncharacterized protein n=1 Tax=Anguilla anguilla TaxID=7936 RepID=A0A0E9PLV4_ANGAN